MTDLYLRRKLTFRAHGRTLVLVKRSNEKFEQEASAAIHARLRALSGVMKCTRTSVLSA